MANALSKNRPKQTDFLFQNFEKYYFFFLATAFLGAVLALAGTDFLTFASLTTLAGSIFSDIAFGANAFIS